MRRIAGALLILALCTSVIGQDVIVSGLKLAMPDECEVGELVRLDARTSEVDSIVWKIIPATDDMEIVDDGKRCFFSSRAPGVYTIILAGAKGGEAFLEHRTLTVAGGVEVPVSDLTAKVKRWLYGVGVADRSDKLRQMANVYRTMAASDTPLDEMMKATALGNRAVLGDDFEPWVPFFEKQEKYFEQLESEGGFKDRASYNRSWIELAKAYEANA